MKDTALRRPNWRAYLTNSIAPKRAIMSVPAPASASRFPALYRGDAWHDFGGKRADRSGAVLTIRLPIPTASSALDTAA